MAHTAHTLGTCSSSSCEGFLNTSPWIGTYRRSRYPQGPNGELRESHLGSSPEPCSFRVHGYLVRDRVMALIESQGLNSPQFPLGWSPPPSRDRLRDASSKPCSFPSSDSSHLETLGRSRGGSSCQRQLGSNTINYYFLVSLRLCSLPVSPGGSDHFEGLLFRWNIQKIIHSRCSE